MEKLIQRTQTLTEIRRLIEQFPATAILGARQCGKTTLARQISARHYFDLENPRDLAKLDHPHLAMENLEGLIVIDEIQRKPDLFPLLRVLIDSDSRKKFLILGSVSRELIRQSSESLAGRIAYFHLAGLQPTDVGSENFRCLWLQGGFPRAYLAESPQAAQLWLDQYIAAFLERDIPQLGITIPAQTLRRFWLMISHYHGQIVNYAEIAGSFGVTDYTVRKYLDILAGTFMVRLLQPWHVNIGKRLVKRPKIYLRDSGIFHNLQSIDTFDTLTAHPKLGASWEGFALESVTASLGKRQEEIFFWRTHNGNEVDLFWQHHGKNWGIEFKYADAPRLTASMRNAAIDLRLAHLWIVYPGRDAYSLADNIIVVPLADIGPEWRYP
jgi:uncharacterized protein